MSQRVPVNVSSFCEAGFITSGGANVYHDKLDDLEQIVPIHLKVFHSFSMISAFVSIHLSPSIGGCLSGCSVPFVSAWSRRDWYLLCALFPCRRFVL